MLLRLSKVDSLMCVLLAFGLRWLSLDHCWVNCQIDDELQSLLELAIYFTLLFAEYASEYLFYLPSKLCQLSKYRIL